VQRLTPEQLTNFLAGVPSEFCDTILELRDFVLRTTPAVDEAIRFHALCYFKPGLRYGAIGGNVCMIAPKQACIRLDFIHGAFLPDPAGLLQGSAKSKRYVEIHSARDIQRGPIQALLRAALAHTPATTTEL
jgi:hypothetical protein